MKDMKARKRYLERRLEEVLKKQDIINLEEHRIRGELQRLYNEIYQQEKK